MSELIRSHDRFFKKLLSDPARAREYLQAFLPAQVLRLLVLDTLRPEKGSFVSDRLEEAFSDMIFSVRTLARQYVNICFLIEHKSTKSDALHRNKSLYSDDKNMAILLPALPIGFCLPGSPASSPARDARKLCAAGGGC